MIERTQQPPATVHSQVAHCPNHGSSHIRSENGIIGGEFVEHLGYILRMNRQLSRLSCCQVVQILARRAIVVERCIYMTAVLLLLDPRQQLSLIHISEPTRQ